MSKFKRYIGIDYSGAKTPTASLKGLRVYGTDNTVLLAALKEIRASGIDCRGVAVIDQNITDEILEQFNGCSAFLPGKGAPAGRADRNRGRSEVCSGNGRLRLPSAGFSY